jgi:NhaA family Na+:H+ antiporter
MRRPDGSSPLHETEHALHPWVTYLILPTFAFANAGVSFAGVTWSTLLEPVTLGIAAGLVVGKAVGVFGATWLMVRSGLAEQPSESSWMQLFGVSLVCGIGFTMSLFIGGLAFEGQDPSYELRVKLGVLCGSLLAATLGSLVLLKAAHRPQ